MAPTRVESIRRNPSPERAAQTTNAPRHGLAGGARWVPRGRPGRGVCGSEQGRRSGGVTSPPLEIVGPATRSRDEGEGHAGRSRTRAASATTTPCRSGPTTTRGRSRRTPRGGGDGVQPAREPVPACAVMGGAQPAVAGAVVGVVQEQTHRIHQLRHQTWERVADRVHPTTLRAATSAGFPHRKPNVYLLVTPGQPGCASTPASTPGSGCAGTGPAPTPARSGPAAPAPARSGPRRRGDATPVRRASRGDPG